MLNNLFSRSRLPVETLRQRSRHYSRDCQHTKFLTRCLMCRRVFTLAFHQDSKVRHRVDRKDRKRVFYWDRELFILLCRRLMVVGSPRRFFVKNVRKVDSFPDLLGKATWKEGLTNVKMMKSGEQTKTLSINFIRADWWMWSTFPDSRVFEASKSVTIGYELIVLWHRSVRGRHTGMHRIRRTRARWNNLYWFSLILTRMSQ